MGTLKQCQVDIFTHKSVDNPFTHKLLMELSLQLCGIMNNIYNHMAQIVM